MKITSFQIIPPTPGSPIMIAALSERGELFIGALPPDLTIPVKWHELNTPDRMDRQRACAECLMLVGHRSTCSQFSFPKGGN